MAGKPLPRSNLRIILALSFLGISLLIFLSTLSPLRTPSTSSTAHFHIPNAETSFVTSLEHFLTHSDSAPSLPDDTVRQPITEQDIKNLNDAVHQSETNRLYSNPYYPFDLPIRVYVYNMPSKFTFDLLLLFRNTYRDTSNLTSNGSPVHRLIEQVLQFIHLWIPLFFSYFVMIFVISENFVVFLNVAFD